MSKNEKIINSLIRSHLKNLAPYEAADPPEILAAKAGILEEDIVKLNANENPFGPSPKAAYALNNISRVHIYPDPAQLVMRKAVANYVGLSEENIVVGNGSDELIDMLFRVTLDPDDIVIDSVPTFGMYSFVAEFCGAKVIRIERDSNFEINLPEVITASESKVAKIIILASPNNPTSNSASIDTIKRLLETDKLVIVDEAYFEFGGISASNLINEFENLVILRTMSKWAGLAGLRIGYGLMAPELASLLLRTKPPYNVSQAAEVALLASIDDAELLKERANLIISERNRMSEKLSLIDGVKPWKSDANFILCELPPNKGKLIYESLAQKGIFVRYFGGGRLADFIRISIGSSVQTDQLIASLEKAIKENE